MFRWSTLTRPCPSRGGPACPAELRASAGSTNGTNLSVNTWCDCNCVRGGLVFRRQYPIMFIILVTGQPGNRGAFDGAPGNETRGPGSPEFSSLNPIGPCA